MRAIVGCLLAALMLGTPPAAMAAGGGSSETGEQMFTLSELRVPLADSDPVRVMSVKLLLVLDTPENKAAVRSKQKDLEQELVGALANIPTSTAVKPAAPVDVKKVTADILTRSGVKGVKDVLVQKYVLW